MKNLVLFSLLIIYVVIMATARPQVSSVRNGGTANEPVPEYYHRAEPNLKRARRALYTRLALSGIDALMGAGVGVADAVLNSLGIGAGDDDIDDDFTFNLEH